uniref:hypothetical protein n=1 Tax=Epichloe bromicola TaxID=79588 RepID=UPI00226CD1C0|nr:hypothetical protein OYW92_mgp04 [Epichloe bromicola]UYX62220.1 hypothetical protein [Epichloe bromicola]
MFYINNFNLNSFILSLLTFILFLNITLWYLDDFSVKNKYIKFLQVLTPLWLILFTVILIYFNIIILDDYVVLHIDGNKRDISNNVSIGGSIEVNKDAAEVLVRNIGVAGTIAGVSGAVAKAIGKSGIPPLQKAGIIIGSAGAAGAIHAGTTIINKVINSGSNNKNTDLPNTSNINIEGGNKLLNDGFNNLSELKILLLSMNTLASTCLFLLLILFIMFLFKYYLCASYENNIKLNKLIGNKLNSYLIYLVNLNKKTSNVYIFIIFIVLFISLSFECYFITQLYDNLDKFIDLHLKK